MTYTDRQIAYHEAGHAVVAALYGCTVGLTGIDNDGSGGYCRVRKAPSNWAAAAYSLAGGAALRRLDPLAPEPLSPGDISSAAIFLSQHRAGDGNRESNETLLARLQGEVERAVAEHWGHVQAVAAAILKLRHLTGSDMETLLPRPAATGFGDRERTASRVFDVLERLVIAPTGQPEG